MTTGARTVLVAVDGMDHDVIMRLGADVLPALYTLVADSVAHGSTLPPDSVPSWMSIMTGIAPEDHGQLHNANFMLEGDGAKVDASLNPYEGMCLWDKVPGTAIAVLNPFLAFPPWAPKGCGAMVSGPSFAEEQPQVADPHGLLVGTTPTRMGGFAGIPRQADLEQFADTTFAVAEAQFQYALMQLQGRRWDFLSHTCLTVDRIQHYAWRHFDTTDPTHPGAALAHLVPRAYQQVDQFIRDVQALSQPGDVVAVVSDHGHGQRAHIGVNFNEIFRREGLLLLEQKSPWRRAVETAKTRALQLAGSCHLEESALWVARRLPGKSALKKGTVAGTPLPGSVNVPDVGGSNPFGGIRVGDPTITNAILDLLNGLTYQGTPVVRWCRPAEEVLHSGCNDRGVYPDLLFELDPRFGPTWNMYGREFMPIVTHKRQSGGHTQRAVFATNAVVDSPKDSVDVHHALISLAKAA